MEHMVVDPEIQEVIAEMIELGATLKDDGRGMRVKLTLRPDYRSRNQEFCVVLFNEPGVLVSYGLPHVSGAGYFEYNVVRVWEEYRDIIKSLL